MNPPPGTMTLYPGGHFICLEEKEAGGKRYIQQSVIYGILSPMVTV